MSRGPIALGVLALAIAVGAGGARVGADSTAGEPEPPRPWLGISYDARPSQGIYGLPVTNVFEESGALASGLRVGDEIVEIDGTPTTPGTDLSGLVGPRAIGDKLTMRVYRGDQLLTLYPVLTPRVSDSEMLHRQLVGKRAPAFSLVRVDDPDALPIEDSILAGKVGLVAWFDRSCRDCPAIVNQLAPWLAEHRKDGVVGVAGISGTRADVAQLQAILASTPVIPPIGYDEDAWLKYGLLDRETIDHTVSISVIDRGGTVRMAAAVKTDDPAALDDVRAAAERALKQRTPRR